MIPPTLCRVLPFKLARFQCVSQFSDLHRTPSQYSDWRPSNWMFVVATTVSLLGFPLRESRLAFRDRGKICTCYLSLSL